MKQIVNNVKKVDSPLNTNRVIKIVVSLYCTSISPSLPSIWHSTVHPIRFAKLQAVSEDQFPLNELAVLPSATNDITTRIFKVTLPMEHPILELSLVYNSWYETLYYYPIQISSNKQSVQIRLICINSNMFCKCKIFVDFKFQQDF